MNPVASDGRVGGSFRDPSGFLFVREGVLYRQVNVDYRDNYDALIASGLYKRLVDGALLVPHQEVDVPPAEAGCAYRVIQPERVAFVSYPYEWCFSQLKDAALLTLEIQRIAMELGLSLKDASAYNIQFRAGRPVLIDTLSFETYREGSPWVAYRQFCQHFLAPLALMSLTDVRLGQLLRVYIDGVPLDLASSLLPFRSRFAFSLFTHIHLHARSQARYADRGKEARRAAVSHLGLLGLIDSLHSAVRRLQWKAAGTEWANYYSDTNYSQEAAAHKEALVREFLDAVRPRSVWDLGANVGIYSRIPASMGIPTLSFDVDPAAVEKNYLSCRSMRESTILPLLLDLANPSPAMGWRNSERDSLFDRGPADTVLALALIHHLAISNNVPLPKLAAFFHDLSRSAIIEFVPKNDSQVQRLLASREDVFPDYTERAFLEAFSRHFKLERSAKIKDTERSLHLFLRG